MDRGLTPVRADARKREWFACSGVGLRAESRAPPNMLFEPTVSESPYAPPGARVADQAPAPPPFPRPRQVTFAVGLLWVSFGLGFPLSYLAAARAPDIGFHPVLLLFTFAMLVLAAALNVLVYKGRNWARIIVLLLVLVAGLFLFVPSEEPTPPGMLEQALNILSFVLELIAIYLLFSWPGALWFRPREQT